MSVLLLVFTNDMPSAFARSVGMLFSEKRDALEELRAKEEPVVEMTASAAPAQARKPSVGNVMHTLFMSGFL